MPSKDTKSLIKIAREGGMQESAEPLNLGSRVRSLRKARSWTLEQAAQQAGLARSTLSKIENGQMSPTYDALKKLAVGLEISVPQLKDNEGRFMSVTSVTTGPRLPHMLLAHAVTMVS